MFNGIACLSTTSIKMGLEPVALSLLVEIMGIKNRLIIWNNSSHVIAVSPRLGMEKGLIMITILAACQIIGNLELALFTSQTNSN